MGLPCWLASIVPETVMQTDGGEKQHIFCPAVNPMNFRSKILPETMQRTSIKVELRREKNDIFLTE